MVKNAFSHSSLTWNLVPDNMILADFEKTLSFYFYSLTPLTPFPLDRIWIASINKYVDVVNWKVDEWRKEAHSFGKVYTFNEIPETIERQLDDEANLSENENNTSTFTSAFAYVLIQNYRNQDSVLILLDFDSILQCFQSIEGINNPFNGKMAFESFLMTMEKRILMRFFYNHILLNVFDDIEIYSMINRLLYNM